jgi:Kef-type K+ transport system membrane component KefB
MLPHAQRRLITTLFLGTALSISSVKIVALVVRDLGFLRAPSDRSSSPRRFSMTRLAG